MSVDADGKIFVEDIVRLGSWKDVNAAEDGTT